MGLTDKLKDEWTLMLGIPLIALGIYLLIDVENGAWLTIAYTSMVTFGILMFINPVKTHLNNIAFLTCALGVSRIFTGFQYIYPFSKYMFIVALVELAIGSNLLYTTFMFFRGHSRAYRTMIYTSSILFLATMYMVVLILAGDFDTVEYMFYFLSYTDIILLGVIYGLLALALFTDIVHDNGYYERIGLQMKDMGDIVDIPHGMVISAQDTEALITGFNNGLGWKEIDDGGPAIYEYAFTISNKKKTLYATAQRWKGCSDVFFTFSNRNEGTMIQAFRFPADQIEKVKEEISIYGTDGIYVKMIIGGISA